MYQHKQVHHSAGLFSSAPPPPMFSTIWVNSSPVVASRYESRVYETDMNVLDRHKNHKK
jgi:hypothetical protein